MTPQHDLLMDPEMDRLANPTNLKYNEKLLSAMNEKLNALDNWEIGEDKALLRRRRRFAEIELEIVWSTPRVTPFAMARQ